MTVPATECGQAQAGSSADNKGDTKDQFMDDFDDAHRAGPQIWKTLRDFFNQEQRQLILLPILDRSSTVSLRSLDWLVTNYAKKRNLVCKGKQGALFNIHNGYKIALSVYGRNNFDPFRRSRRTAIRIGAETYPTTMGQCHFMYWAHVNGVLQFAERHLFEIEADMNMITMQERIAKKNGSKVGEIRKRSPLTLATQKAFKCHVYEIKSVVNFDM